jgi:MFS family permease
MVNFAGLLPVLLLSLFMGVIVDRFQRRRILLFTQTWFMLLAIALAVLTGLNRVAYWHILVLAALLGIANALDMPTRQAFYIDMVEREELLNAIALNSSVFNGARIIGPAIGGFVVATLGEAPAFALNGLSYTAVIISLLAMRLPPFTPPAREGSSLQELRKSLGYIRGERRILGLVSMVALFSLFGFPYLVLLPAVAKDRLGTGPEGFGALMAAQGAGALISALSLAAFGERRDKGKLLQLSRVLLAVALVGLSLASTQAMAMVALLLAGFALISQLAVTNTMIQWIAPDAMRGRVISTYTWALGGFFPLGSLLSGALGDTLGTSNAILVMAIASFGLSMFARAAFPPVSDTVADPRPTSE